MTLYLGNAARGTGEGGSPFDGIGTVVSEAVRLNRRGVGIELKENWYRPSIGHANAAASADLFSAAGIEVQG